MLDRLAFVPCPQLFGRKMSIIVTGRKPNCQKGTETGHLSISCPENQASVYWLQATEIPLMSLPETGTGTDKPGWISFHIFPKIDAFCKYKQRKGRRVMVCLWQGRGRGKIQTTGPQSPGAPRENITYNLIPATRSKGDVPAPALYANSPSEIQKRRVGRRQRSKKD